MCSIQRIDSRHLNYSHLCVATNTFKRIGSETLNYTACIYTIVGIVYHSRYPHAINTREVREKHNFIVMSLEYIKRNHFLLSNTLQRCFLHMYSYQNKYNTHMNLTEK